MLSQDRKNLKKKRRHLKRQAMSQRWVKHPVLRINIPNQQDRHSTWLESFFDLAFASALANLAMVFSNNLEESRLGQFLIVLTAVIWCWSGESFYSTRFDTDDLPQRVLVFLEIIGVAVMAITAPNAVLYGTAWFALGYAACRSFLVIKYIRAYIHVPEARIFLGRYLIGFSVSISIWVASVWIPYQIRPLIWLIGLALDIATPNMFSKQTQKFPPHTTHIPERFGLFTLILLGEVFAIVINAVTKQIVTGRLILSVASIFIVVFGIWWDYFEGAGGSDARSFHDKRTATAFRVWMYTHFFLTAFLMVFGSTCANFLIVDHFKPIGLHHALFATISLAGCLICTVVIWYSGPENFKLKSIKLSWPFILHALIVFMSAVFIQFLAPMFALMTLAGLIIIRVLISLYKMSDDVPKVDSNILVGTLDGEEDWIEPPKQIASPG